MEVPEIAMNPLLDRFVRIFDVDSTEDIDFGEFVTALSVFSEESNREDKLRCELSLPSFPISREVTFVCVSYFQGV